MSVFKGIGHAGTGQVKVEREREGGKEKRPIIAFDTENHSQHSSFASKDPRLLVFLHLY